MKMRNAKFSPMESTAIQGPGDSGYYPSIGLPLNAIPQLREKEVGGECEIVLKVKIRTITDDGEQGRVDLEVLKAGYMEHGDSGY